MAGYTENSIVIFRDFDTVFDLTNTIELWPLLNIKYEKVEVLERNGNEISYSITTYPSGKSPSRTLVMRRIIDQPNRQVTTELVSKSSAFKEMKIYWSYEELPQGAGVVMTWSQKFEVHEDCKLTTEQMESSIDRDTRSQMQVVKEKIEAWQAKQLV